MTQLLWLALTWIGGTAAILGSLMTLGNLLLWLVPLSSTKSQRESDQPPEPCNDWQGRSKLLGFSITIALLGISLLILLPFPNQ